MQSVESRSTFIRHLRNELESVKESCAKYESLNSTMTQLEHNIKTLRDEKETAAESSLLRDRDLADKIMEAERLMAELREEVKDADQASVESKARLDKLNSEIVFMDGKEEGLRQKNDNLTTFIDELVMAHDSIKDEIEATKKDLAEYKVKMTNSEREQIEMEERVSKLALIKKNLLASLNDHESTERRLTQLKAERLSERDQASVSLQKRSEGFREMNMNAGQLEDENFSVDTDRKRIRDAQVETENRRIQEETLYTDLQADMNSIESRCKNLDDEHRIEDQRWIKAGDAFNDERERSERAHKELHKVKDALDNMDGLCGKVRF